MFIPIYEPEITKQDINLINDAASSGWVSSLGKYINEFEKEFAKYCGTKYALTTANGTVALHLVLESYGIGKGDEVIIPDLTFIATANAVSYTGAIPIPVDIDKNSLCINPKKIEETINNRTKAIIPVHLYGHPAAMVEINKIAGKYNLIVIEDAAEAHGAQIGTQKVGSFGDGAIFSFYGNKIITTGEGGMVTTNDKSLYDKAKELRDHAMSKEKRYWHTRIGYNYRMTNLQAALGLAQLSRIDNIIKRKNQIFKLYKEYLEPIEELEVNYTNPDYKNVYWMICVNYRNWDENSRDHFIVKLKEQGIDTRPYFYPISDMPMYKNNAVEYTSVCHDIYKQGVNLPSSVHLDKSQVKFICEKVKREISKNRY